MNKLAILIIVLGCFDLFAIEPRISRLKASNTNIQGMENKHEKLLEKLLENNKKLSALLQGHSSLPTIWDQRAKILTGKVFRGVLLNSIVSTNLSSPVLISAYPNQGLPPETKFSCQGVTQNKRVFTLCNKMINPEKETVIAAQVLNMDGTSGLVGEYDDGKEDLISGAIISDFAQGMLSAAQSRYTTPFGVATEGGLKNQLLQGAIESGRTTSDVLLEEMKTVEPVVSVDAGEEVLIYFMEASHDN